MRLINCKTMMLQEFMGGGSQAPAYAILSHTWGEEEVTFQEFTHPKNEAKFQELGFQKIRKTCQMALEDGLQYAWVDTCCIDKTSSAELTEAINSMYQWYTDAAVCYAWLADLPAGDSLSLEDPNSCFKDCRWFTRGWALQELIAPKVLKFYDHGWNFRGAKADLSDVISRVTKIDAEVLQNSDRLHNLPVAKRMSWAAARQTTRIEDMAYCLLGIFDVNMPLLYGEGTKAFTRLQEEIIKESNDLSLFAWRSIAMDQIHRGILARTPSEFCDSESINLINDKNFNPDFLITNKGLRVTSDLHPGQDGAYLIPLNCSQPDGTCGNQQIGIWVKQHGGGVYSRVKSDKFGIVTQAEIGRSVKSRSLFISKSISPTLSATMDGSHRNAFMLRNGFNERGIKIHDPNSPFEATSVQPREEWDAQRRMFLTHGASSFTACAFMFSRKLPSGKFGDTKSFLVAFGKTEDSTEPWLTLDAPGGDLMKHMQDLNKLGAMGINYNKRSVALSAHFEYSSMRVDVSLEKVVMDGQEVYCIDLSYT